MIPSVRELYHELIVDHSTHPRNFGKLDGANRTATGYNALCGDRLTLYLAVENDLVKEIQFQGVGCAISIASASLMTEQLKGKTIAQAEAVFKEFHCLVTEGELASGPKDQLGKLRALAGVGVFPVRVKCATLPWHTLLSAIRGRERELDFSLY